MPVRDEGRPVVVGYDGSAESRMALRWAVEDARLRFLPLLVCHAWQWPYPRLSSPRRPPRSYAAWAGASLRAG